MNEKYKDLPQKWTVKYRPLHTDIDMNPYVAFTNHFNKLPELVQVILQSGGTNLVITDETPWHLYKENKKTGWVRIKNQLPEIGEIILASNVERMFFATRISTIDGSYMIIEAYFGTDVTETTTHWMRLPKKPLPTDNLDV